MAISNNNNTPSSYLRLFVVRFFLIQVLLSSYHRVSAQSCGGQTCTTGQQKCCGDPTCGICVDVNSDCPTSTCIERVPCGAGECISPQVCCSASCQTCVDPGAPCQPDETCAACGSKVCPSGQVCCNASCETCAAPGAPCTLEICSPCGDTLCLSNQECCNQSCGGICTSIGGTCNKDPCVYCNGVTCPQSVPCVNGICTPATTLSSTAASSEDDNKKEDEEESASIALQELPITLLAGGAAALALL